MIEYSIAKKNQFTVMGISRRFDPDTSYQEIPKFWDEMVANKDLPVMGKYGVCVDFDEAQRVFDYWIADDYDPAREVPAGCGTLVIPARDWAVFPCNLKTLQQINTAIWEEWLPNCGEYRLDGNFSIEMYAPICGTVTGEEYAELWVPVERV